MTDDTHIARISKRNWDRLLLPVVIVSVLFTFLFGFLADFWDAFTLPMLTFAGWLYLRTTTPPLGKKAVSIDGNPKVKALLKWLAFMLLLTATWAFVDTTILGNSLDAPLKTFQVILFVALIALLLSGVLVIEHRFPPAPAESKDGG